MANTFQQLPGAQERRTSFAKVLYPVLFLAAIAIAFFSFSILKTSQTIAVSLRDHLCNQAYDHPFCLALLSEVAHPSSGNMQSGDADVFRMILAKSSSQIRESMEYTKHVKGRINDKKGQAALEDCLELMDLSIDRITDSMVALGSRTGNFHSDVHSWLSGVLTNHVTCLDGLYGAARSVMEPMMNELILRARTLLVLVVAIAPEKQELLQPLNGDFPSWITSKERRLLGTPGKYINADSVVAQDGSGDYSTVQAAVDAAPDKSQTRHVIYVKNGTYKEQVNVGKKKKNLMLVGDGMDSTIITGSLNVKDGSSTFRSATVAAVAEGFIAQDLWIQNTAGPQKHQAVALRVGADQSVINRCKIEAYQDTLYAHSLRQFYRDCYITGTVDFIFGNAAVVIQNSRIEARKPMSGQKNMVTAQGRTDPCSATGISIQNCDIVPSSDLDQVKESVQTFLGRPWKEYSRTVVMQSNISDHINPAGWFPWDGDFALNTLYYGEYMNRGPGAGTSDRVNWTGYHVITSEAEASQFTVAELIQGRQWLENTGVTYTEGL